MMVHSPFKLRGSCKEDSVGQGYLYKSIEVSRKFTSK